MKNITASQSFMARSIIGSSIATTSNCFLISSSSLPNDGRINKYSSTKEVDQKTGVTKPSDRDVIVWPVVGSRAIIRLYQGDHSYRQKNKFSFYPSLYNHVVARERWGIPSTSAEAVKLIIQHGVLGKDKEPSLVQMVKFRNRIVHLYQEVDDSEIYRILQENLDDIKDFIQAVMNKFF